LFKPPLNLPGWGDFCLAFGKYFLQRILTPSFPGWVGWGFCIQSVIKPFIKKLIYQLIVVMGFVICTLIPNATEIIFY